MPTTPGSREPDPVSSDSKPRPADDGSKDTNPSAKILLPFSVDAIMAKDDSRPSRPGWRLNDGRCSPPPTDPRATSRTSPCSTAGPFSAPSTPASFSVDGILNCHRSRRTGLREAPGTRSDGGRQSADRRSNEEQTSSAPSSNRREATDDEIPDTTGNTGTTPTGNRSPPSPPPSRSLEASPALGLTASAVFKWSNGLGYHPWIECTGDLQNSIVREYRCH